jgi:peptidoglycan/LPS O-acetylase OafA/YrhL
MTNVLLKKNKIYYSREIQGLRAISVFLVIFYHAGFHILEKPIFQGGFIGVDIFFVISGYLITTLILKEIFQTDNFLFNIFYERRIRRIIPPLFFVMIIFLFVSYIFLSPVRLVEFTKSIISAVLFVSNYFFYITDNLYQAESILLKPFAHTWSLAVEFQFYFIIPILYFFLLKFFKKNFLAILFILFFISLFLNYFLKDYSNLNFYQLPTRLFEFFSGSLISYFQFNKKNLVIYKSRSYIIISKILPSVGIFLIIFSSIFFNLNKIQHPSFVTLIPVTGAILVIIFSKKGEIINKILTHNSFVFFGLISYSLFLWHYPIFSFLRLFQLFDSYEIKILSIIFIIIISIFSYYFIEKPFQNKNIISLKKLIICIILSLIFFLIFFFYTLKTDGAKNRFKSFINPLSHQGEIKYYRNGKQGNVVLLGDSHAQRLAHDLNESLKRENYNLYRLNTLYYVQDFNKVDRKTKNIYQEFIDQNIIINKFLEKNKNLIVVFSQKWTSVLLEGYFVNEENAKEFFSEEDRITKFYLEPTKTNSLSLEERQKYLIQDIKLTINKILSQGHIVILIYPVPELGFDPPQLLLKNILLLRIKSLFNYEINLEQLSISYQVYKKRNKIIFETLDSIKDKNIYRIYPHKYFCETEIKNRCIANNNEDIFYEDNNHLSIQGSNYVIKDIIKIIKKIEKY